MKRSLAMRSTLLTAFKSLFDGSVLNVYSGTVPTSADAALPSDATLLCSISKEGTGAGISFDSDVSQGVLVKNSSEIWSGTVVASGKATFFRLQKPNDDGSASTTLARLQGTTALIDADLNLSSLDFVPGNERRMKAFTVSVPAG
ncbi:hypothetical protein SB18R_03265 [Pseudomonas oryzihabitans]|nr:hypothetical protein SB9_12500 [Pseudomonas psychrotolerans]KTT78263.1 hypothetical protein SB18R_03265 [Pseudomonas psychrotolerans]